MRYDILLYDYELYMTLKRLMMLIKNNYFFWLKIFLIFWFEGYFWLLRIVIDWYINILGQITDVL